MNNLKNALLISVILSAVSGCQFNDSDSKLAHSFATVEALGESLFLDKNLSANRTQSCATCHSPDHAFIDPRENEASQVGVSLGDDDFSIGVRNAPTASYAQFASEFHFMDEENGWQGGQFLDGREADLKGQAGGPPLNPVEMGMPDKAAVIARIQENPEYVAAFEAYFGETVFEDTDNAYLNMTIAIAKFEKTDAFAPFDSKWDDYLLDEYTLSFKELTGKSVFFSQENSSCVNCHMLNDVKTATRDPEQTFSNYRYFNLGVPKNQALIDLNQAKGLNAGFIEKGDMGLFENPVVEDEAQKGKFKTPTLRNVAVTAPYMHNGVFKDLKTVLEFYNHRGSVDGSRSPTNPETGEAWADTPFPTTINHDLLGQTAMSEAEIEGLECFLRLLTDKKYESLLPTTRTDGSVIQCQD